MSLSSQFIEHISNHEALINKVVFLYTDNVEDRKDLQQEIISQAWKSFPSFRGDAKFSTWLYRVAMNVSITYIKKKTRTKSLDFSTQKIFVSSTNESELLEEILKILNPIEKSIVILQIEGYSQPEIAEILGLSGVNTRTKIHRIRKKLKQYGIDKLT